MFRRFRRTVRAPIPPACKAQTATGRTDGFEICLPRRTSRYGYTEGLPLLSHGGFVATDDVSTALVDQFVAQRRDDQQQAAGPGALDDVLAAFGGPLVIAGVHGFFADE